ncbi:MAG: hypothetical protein D6782_02755 [Alphaproteobacteria bacterium]|nr:MAG: hypothetical protein D6782_02755 [Alphaproteobacteria bacterium]
MKFLPKVSDKKAPLVIYDKAAYVGACDLIKKFGTAAALEALNKADRHEVRGERQQTYYWRRVESAVNILLTEEALGPPH